MLARAIFDSASLSPPRYSTARGRYSPTFSTESSASADVWLWALIET